MQQETAAIFVEIDRIFREKTEQLPRCGDLSVDDAFGVVSVLIAQRTAVTIRLIVSGHYRELEDLQSVIGTMACQLLIAEYDFLPGEG